MMNEKRIAALLQSLWSGSKFFILKSFFDGAKEGWYHGRRNTTIVVFSIRVD